jgi:hypothetical protein
MEPEQPFSFLQASKPPIAAASKSFFFKRSNQLYDQINSMRGINPEVAHLFPQSVKNSLALTAN